MTLIHGCEIPDRPDTTPIHWRRLRARAWAGEIPAEALTTRERDQLVYDLWAHGWTDVEIATHTRMTTYTTVRIRYRLGLKQHRTQAGRAA